MPGAIGRRQLLTGAGAAVLLGGLEGCAATVGAKRAPPAASLQLTPVRASTDRITRITVCTRPFRAHGPRLDAERVGSKLIVHNYGHGGSGWSLSWGSSSIAVRKAMATGERDIAVIGCGALGLTSALLLQRAGARVTIYAKELPPNVRSSLATGLWTPDSRICLEENATPAFKQLWEDMARTSFQTYQNFLGLPGTPVEFIDSYFVSDDPASTRRPRATDGRPPFADLQRERIGDLMPQSAEFAPGSHSLGARYLRRNSFMMFNLSAYGRLLMGDFIANGGKIEIAEFHTPDDFAGLREKTLINATGYGARALFGDQTVTPVRGQLARTIPQPDIDYGLFYKGVSFVPRRDGLVFQVVGDSDYYGFDDETAVADRAEADRAVNTIAGLFNRQATFS
ncbi:MAG: FAD-binding oxidoreductase [Pseudomonadota bacterium]|nr:FAD-binding oxidoreductase [Pseudomonadota bacterium]